MLSRDAIAQRIGNVFGLGGATPILVHIAYEYQAAQDSRQLLPFQVTQREYRNDRSYQKLANAGLIEVRGSPASTSYLLLIPSERVLRLLE